MNIYTGLERELEFTSKLVTKERRYDYYELKIVWRYRGFDWFIDIQTHRYNKRKYLHSLVLLHNYISDVNIILH